MFSCSSNNNTLFKSQIFLRLITLSITYQYYSKYIITLRITTVGFLSINPLLSTAVLCYDGMVYFLFIYLFIYFLYA